MPIGKAFGLTSSEIRVFDLEVFADSIIYPLDPLTKANWTYGVMTGKSRKGNTGYFQDT